MSLTIGFATPTNLWNESFEAKRQILQQLDDAGIDQVYMADHVSFRDGSGTDGFVEIAALSQLHPSIRVMISVYLLALRHPLPVARQLATMSQIAPGRFTLGVGVGGEDRHEIEVCGVDPSTRGRRTNESLEIIRGLMSGDAIDFSGEFFELDQARIKPAIPSNTPIIIGGRSNAALARTARYGDGWVGTWCSARRFGEAVGIIAEEAEALGRGEVDWQHGYQPWVGVAATTEKARNLVAAEMESFYKVPFAAFEKYTPYGTAAQVADSLRPYLDAGCSMINLKVVAQSDRSAIEAASEIADMLRS
ncbi:MAG: LLM class flavin-dependent oxidoreductase [Acidimicrobiales bacterium]|jgi:alkanesulfonate monooxygenase SsuD/methylene tetrahydromethanopterin reductase-like flavin-dependent oxidoreductase (luciferase family)